MVYDKTKREPLSWSRNEDINDVKICLQNDQIVISSTDTICGFLTNGTEESFKKLHDIKGERGDKPYLVLTSLKKLDQFVDVTLLSKKMQNVIKHCWPGPLTIIFKAKKDLSNFLVSRAGTIALRCPCHDGLQGLLKGFDGLFSTSANKSGKTAPSFISQVDSELLKDVECVIGDNNENKELPSSIIDFSHVDFTSQDKEQEKLQVVREGAFSREELERYYEEV